ncbi:MAG: NAD(P)/FAD-dependent oxidoreductase [Alphaproteobacteria bacterium]
MHHNLVTLEKDIAIIGAGPTGLFSVFECGFMGYTCAVIDALPHTGGQLAALYPEKPIYDIAGHPSILAGDLVTQLEAQAAPFHPAYVLGNPVEKLEKAADGRFVLSTKTHTVTAKVVIIAGGAGMFTPRKPQVENLAAFENISVHYAVREKSKFAGHEVVIAGGGDSAIDWAVELAEDVAKHVHVVHRRSDFRAAEATLQKMHTLVAAGKITLHTPAQLHSLQGENGQIASITLADLDGNTTVLPAQTLLCFFGLLPNPGPFSAWNLAMDGKCIATEPLTQKSSVDGILVVGDMASYPNKVSLILTGFAEAVYAAKTAQALIDPAKKFKVQYSTSHKPGGAA